MKLLLHSILLVVISIFSTSSICISQINVSVLDRNATSGMVTDRGILFHDPATSNPGYEVPKGSGNNLIYSLSFWFGAIDENGTLCVAAQKYMSGQDFYPGPYSQNNAYSSSSYLNNYLSSIWNVTKQEVEAHVLEYTMNGSVANPATSILNWPANGDASIGVADDLAPYVDVDNDGFYDPYQGDYPDIKGCEATYIIFNDAAGPHTETNGNPLGIEVHLMLYQYATNNYLDTTTFIDMRTINRGGHMLYDLRAAIYNDADIGNYGDDYCGSDSTRNMILTYNANSVDPGYGSTPPCLAIKCLNDKMENFGYYTGGSVYPYTDPSSAIEYWNYMHGLWQDGSEWYYGGMGYQGSAGVTLNQTNYMFSGDASGQNYWTEMNVDNMGNANPPGDRRNFMTVEEQVLAPGVDVRKDFAIIAAFGSDNLNSVNRAYQIADSVQYFYDNFIDFCDDVLSLQEQPEELQLELYPNPNPGNFQVVLPDNIAEAELELIDPSGRIVGTWQLNQKKTQIRTDQSEGIYIARIRTAHQLYSSLIVIQNP